MDVMPLPYFEVDVPIRSTDQPGPGLLEHGHQVHQLARPGRRLGSLRGWNTMGTILGVGDFSGDVKADLATVTNDSYDGAECGLPPHVQRPRHGRDRGGRGAGPELVEAERRLLAERSGVNVKTPAPPGGVFIVSPCPIPVPADGDTPRSHA